MLLITPKLSIVTLLLSFHVVSSYFELIVFLTAGTDLVWTWRFGSVGGWAFCGGFGEVKIRH